MQKSQDPVDTEVTHNSPQQETVSSSQQNENGNEITQPVVSDRGLKSRSRSLSSSTTSDVLFVKTSIAQRPKFTSRYQNQSWYKNYLRRYGCRLCSKICFSRGNMTNHLKTHNRLKERHQDILKNFCNVPLEKIDGKPNMTKLRDTVMYTKDKIYTDGDKLDFFTYYILKETTDKVLEPDRATRRLNSFSNYDSSDDENFVIKRSTKKRRRLMSDSSKETVVLEGDNNKNSVSSGNESESNTTESNVIDCINIDDSSDSESYTSNNEKNGEDTKNITCAIPNIKDDKTLQNIISKCYNKYMQKKKYSSRPENFDSLLKTKMLSMGIKVLHPQNAINCTGLLRYTEYKKLNIKWTPTSKVGFGRIMPKLKPRDDSVNDNLRWKDLPGDSMSKPFKIYVNLQDDTVLKPTTSNEKANKLPYLVVLPVNDTCINSVVSSSEHDNLKEQNPPHKSDESTKQNKSSHQLEGHLKELKAQFKQEGHSKENKPIPKPEGSVVLLYSYSPNTDSDMKLLNASPVANPKQLPKKTNLSEAKLNIKPTIDAVVVPNVQPTVPIYLDDEENHAGRTEALCMPIITSTTSLAVDTLNHNEKGSNDKCHSNNSIFNQNVSKELEKSVPRIKVKPASELMSQQAFNNLSSQSQQPAATSMWNLKQNATVSVESQNLPNNANINTDIGYAPAPSEKPRECVILDTVEFPNTKTDSPINYFKNLLLIHSIVLLDSTENSTKKFFRLLKFKLLLNEDSMARPVVLCLALQCAENEFCLEVRGLYQENINLQELSANWQWEIIKVFKGNVEENLLKNAQKVSHTVYEYTKSFLCLLKSINFKTVT